MNIAVLADNASAIIGIGAEAWALFALFSTGRRRGYPFLVCFLGCQLLLNLILYTVYWAVGFTSFYERGYCVAIALEYFCELLFLVELGRHAIARGSYPVKTTSWIIPAFLCVLGACIGFGAVDKSAYQDFTAAPRVIEQFGMGFSLFRAVVGAVFSYLVLKRPPTDYFKSRLVYALTLYAFLSLAMSIAEELEWQHTVLKNTFLWLTVIKDLSWPLSIAALGIFLMAHKHELLDSSKGAL